MINTSYDNLDNFSAYSRENLLKEYIRFLPYSISISSFFLMMLVEPPQMSTTEMLAGQMPDEELIENTMKQGGEVVDCEVAHQVWEMYELSRLHNIEIDEDIDTKDWVDSEVLDLINCKSQ